MFPPEEVYWHFPSNINSHSVMARSVHIEKAAGLLDRPVRRLQPLSRKKSVENPLITSLTLTKDIIIPCWNSQGFLFQNVALPWSGLYVTNWHRSGLSLIEDSQHFVAVDRKLYSVLSCHQYVCGNIEEHSWLIWRQSFVYLFGRPNDGSFDVIYVMYCIHSQKHPHLKKWCWVSGPRELLQWRY